MKRLHDPVSILSVGLGLALAFVSMANAAEPASAKPEADPMAFARGARAWADNCGRCHNIRDARELRDDQWAVSVAHMRIRAGLTGQDARDILKFLQESN